MTDRGERRAQSREDSLVLGLSREETTVFMEVLKGVLILDILDILKLCQQVWMQSVRENGLEDLDRWKNGIVIN